MQSFPDDSNATAVILADIGKVTFNSDFEMSFTRHRRIKILRESGYEWGDVAVPFYGKDKLQWVTDVEGQTFVMSPNGAIRKEKLDKKSIFNEDVDKEWRRIRFTMPALAPGAVLEYRYTINSENSTFLREWYFQTSEPTLWSEFSTNIPDILLYVMVTQNVHVFDIKESNRNIISSSSTAHYSSTTNRWALRNVPALRREPYMTTLDDYRAQIRFQLKKVVYPTGGSRNVMNTWEELAKSLLDDADFGRQIERHKILREQTENLVAGLTSPIAKMRAIYDYVRTTMVWNGERRVFAKDDLDKVFQARRGNSAEIALMLTSMLRFAGIDAQPVLVSTRNNGQPIQVYSILTQFNHVITCAIIGGRENLLDATDPLRPSELLPVAALNGVGWLVDKENPRWIKISNPGRRINYTMVSASLSADGRISGDFESNDAEYSALNDRHTLQDKKDEQYIQDGWLKDFTGAQLDSFEISHRDSIDVPLHTKAYFSSGDHAQVAGDKIYFNPVFFGREKENPFKLPHRIFPVDYAYGIKQNYTLKLQLPDGYVAQELPKDMYLALPRDGGHFRRVTRVDDGLLQIMTQFEIKKPVFAPNEYGALREFFDRVVASHAEQVVLARNTATAEGDSK